MNARVEFFKNQIGKDKWQFPYPLMDWMTAEAVEAEEGFVKMRFTVKEYMLNPIQILHGGVAATMLDELMGAAGFLMNRPVGYATINMNVDYLHSAKVNDVLIGEGKIIRAGKTVMHAEAKLTNADGKVIAKATSNLIATQIVVNM
ncbi:MAG TPA: PaaI family thioesterase [Chitinophagales bacterium]|nr:PaaI family thioesterase [Chitinophagales bacterium]